MSKWVVLKNILEVYSSEGQVLCFVGSNVSESGRCARGCSKTCDWSEGQSALRWDLEKRGSVEGNQGISHTDIWYIQ